MFETGRWRRYHSEIAFLENIQEAKRAVETWRALATGGGVAEATAGVTSASGWSPAPDQQAQTMQPKAVHIVPETVVPVRLDPKPDVLAEIIETAAVPPPLPAAAATVSFTAPAEMPLLRAPAARPSWLAAPEVRSPVAGPPQIAPAAMAALEAQFARPDAEGVATPEDVVEFTFNLDGLEAKYPLLRNAF